MCSSKKCSTICSLDEMSLDGVPSEFLCSSLSFELVNRGLAAVFLLVGGPLMIAIALYTFLSKSGPVLYSGVRLGKAKRPFLIYKFRTLPIEYNKAMGAFIVERKQASIPPFYWFLRETRLDELPQLFNVLRGDMLLVGPRPIRPEVYLRYCRGIADFDRRFWGKPGLIGVSQLLTPSGTPKRIRARLDNLFQEKKNNAQHTMAMVGFTIFLVLRKVMVKGIYAIWRNLIYQKLLKKEKDRRFYERIPQDETIACFQSFEDGKDVTSHWGIVLDINETTMRLYCNTPFHTLFGSIKLKSRVVRHGKQKVKTAYCSIESWRSIKSDDRLFLRCYVVDYSPLTPFSQYIVDKYILRKSMAERI